MAKKIEDYYLAEGFEEDSQKLLQEFVELESPDFGDFARIWKKNHFSLVFMGRPDDVEAAEFTNEIFRVSSEYLSSSSYYLQIGAIYLLYSLFRNQILQPPVMIRLKIEQWDIVKALFLESIKKKYKSLYYVINFLRENAFVYVENHVLRSPLVGMIDGTPKKEETVNMPTQSTLMEYSATNHLAELAKIHEEYLEAKKNMNTTMNIPQTNLSKFYTDAIKEMNEMLNPGQNTSESLGDRRAKIKAEAFTNKVKNHLGIISDDDDDSETDPDYIDYDMFTRKRRQSRPKRPEQERKVGRPRKQAPKPSQEKSSDDEPIDIDRLKLQQRNFYLPPVNCDGDTKKRSKRTPYYKTSPKREDIDSDSDSD